MGLMDILNGMQNGPRGQRDAAPSGGGGMPTWMMALLGLLAYKAVKGGGLGNMLGGGQAQAPYQQPSNQTGGGLGDVLGGMLGGGSSPRGGGGLGDILGGALAGGAASGGLGGLLGGLLGGGGGGNVLSGGLRNLVQDMEQNGHADEVQSWVGRGENRAIAPTDLAHAVGIDDIDAVAQQTGMPREQLVSELSQHLPEFVNQLTPDGRLPTEQEAGRWV
jgi:uncharacterized protein YidB (DUF937 family)